MSDQMVLFLVCAGSIASVTICFILGFWLGCKTVNDYHQKLADVNEKTAEAIWEIIRTKLAEYLRRNS